MNFLHLIWLIPVLPLAGFAINGLLGKRFLPKQMVAGIACLAVLGSFVISAGAILDLHDEQGLADLLNSGEAVSALGAVPSADGFGASIGHTDPQEGLVLDPSIPRARQIQWSWIAVGDLSVKWAYSLDPLSAVMLLVVTGVGFLIHVYSVGYMAHEEGFERFFAYLNLFMAMMLVLVLADSFLVMFVGWEGVGLCSYLLIGFNYREMFNPQRNQSCADAGRKAFIVNRIGDFGFMLGMLFILVTFGSLEFGPVFRGVHELAAAPGSQGLLTIMALLLFVGATGKSAQIPLFVWLPDAMAGPTPVSALIHAATMVTAGVYMVCRCAALFTAAPIALTTVAVVGGATALVAAIIACTQTDIKKVLAYSTVSQLGYMFLAVGVGAFSFAIFHVMTHAFFKALLFLGAGSVIHALSGEQDIRRMGRLTRALPWTWGTFAVAAVAIAGIPPLAGFFSKDSILAATYFEQPWLWGLGVFTAGLTAFYIWRLVFLTFLSTDRVEKEVRGHLHESPWSMLAPLVILAVLAAVGGFVGVPAFLADSVPGLHGVAEALPHYLEPVFREARVAGTGMGALGLHGAAPTHGADAAVGHGAVTAATEWGLMGLSVLVALAGIFLAAFFYARGGDLPARLAAAMGSGYRLVRDRFRIDELYDLIILKPFYFACRAADAFDRFVIDLLVNAVAILTEIAGHVLKLFQTGSVRAYALSIFAGAVALLALLVFS
jgi:NADH-quinone oxidoreductase subunit L